MSALVVPLAFGVPSTILPNTRIGGVASRKAMELNVGVYTQFDVPITAGVEVTRTPEKPGEPPPTLRIARGAVEFAISGDVQEIWVACAGPHVWRAMRDFMFAVREQGADINVFLCEEVDKRPAKAWFSQESTQRRTRSPWKFWPRELFLRALPMWVYKQIAS